jgi:ankyrin repeat protein
MNAGSSEVAKMLIEAGADVNANDYMGKTALILAYQEGNEEIVKLLIDGGADVNAEDKEGQTALMKTGSSEAAKMLIEAGADLNEGDYRGKTALIMASQEGSEGLVKLLIDAGADVNAKDSYGQTALFIAKKKGYGKIEILLIKHGAKEDPELRGEKAKPSSSPITDEDLLLGAKPSILKRILQDASDENRKKQAGYILWKGGEWNRIDLVELALDNGANVEGGEGGGTTPLMWASRLGHINVVKLLLERGADVNKREKTSVHDGGHSALSYAAIRGHVEIGGLLLDYGADIESKTNKRAFNDRAGEKTPLMSQTTCQRDTSTIVSS